MARADTLTIIPLDRAARILGVDNYHFNGIVTARRPENNTCDDIWFQHPWQMIGKASREDLASSLRAAEDKVIDYIGYSPVPVWVEEEEQIVERPYAVEFTNYYSRNSRGQWKSIRADLGYVIEAGKRTKSLILANAAVVLSDADGDGYNELATVTVPTTITEAQEVHAYFPGESGDDRWEIRPIDVTISGGNAVITFGRHLIPDPDLWIRDPAVDDPVWRNIDGDVLANFISTVDVYRIYTDPSQQATFYHEASCNVCGGSGCPACSYTTETACLRVRDSRLGILSYSPATWDPDTETYDFNTSCYPDPHKILINYRAGTINRREKYPYLQMDPQWERAIVYYAFATMDRVDSGCENTHNLWKEMTEDLAKVQSTHSYAVTERDLRNPFGTTRAGIQLWRLVERHRLV